MSFIWTFFVPLVAALGFNLANDKDLWASNEIGESHYLNSSSCRSPCRFNNDSGSITVDCTKARCKSIPKELDNETTKLIMMHNKILRINRTMFDSLLNLVYLDLSRCKIRLIEPRSFDVLTRLEFLSLSYNGEIKSYPDGIFDQLRGLKQLNLRRASHGFNHSLFAKLEELEILSFGGNYLTEFPKFLKNEGNRPLLPKLRHLDLEANNIVRISDKLLRGLEKSVETLVLSRNRIYKIENSSFVKMLSLKTLLLDYNYINILECNAFKSSTIEHLSIAFSDFQASPEKKCLLDTFTGLPNLRVLNLSHSFGFRCIYQPQSSQTLLEELDLENTRVSDSYLSHLTASLPRLRRLNLYANNIGVSNADQWNNLALEELNVGQNWIITFNATSFPPRTWKSLKFFDFSGNPLYCDCALVWFQRWLLKTNVTVLNMDLARCSGPPDNKDVILTKTVRPTAVECFRSGHDWWLLTVFLLCLVVSSAATVLSTLYRFRWHLMYWHFKTKSTGSDNHAYALDERSGYGFDAFVSYEPTDARWVIGELIPRLETDWGLRLCVGQRDWMPGADVTESAVDSVRQSRKTVLVASNAFAVSHWSHFELTLAQTILYEEDRDNLIVVLLEEIADCNMNPRLQLQMQKGTYIAWPASSPVGQQLFWAKFRSALTRRSSSVIRTNPPRELFASI